MISFSFRTWLENVAYPPVRHASNDLEVPEPGEENYLFSPRDPAGKAGGRPDPRTLSNVGTPGNPMGRIDAFIDNMVDSWKNFTPTPERVSPGQGGGSNLGDLGAALAGRKVAWFTSSKPHDLSELIMKRIKQRIGNEDRKFARNLTYAQPWAGDQRMGHHVLIGPEQQVRKLAHLVKMQQELFKHGKRVPVPVEKEIGLILGYPESSIREYLCNTIGMCVDPKEKRITHLELGDNLKDMEDMQSLGREFGQALGKKRFPSPEQMDAAPDHRAVKRLMRQIN